MKEQNESRLPVGFAMELAADMHAMDVFARLDENQKKQWIDKARTVHSKDDMRHYVSELKKERI